MKEHLVSIIMPVYNTELFVSEAIQSVLNQSHKNWELLIINDGSTDQSEEKIKQFTDDRIRYFKQNNQGVAKARNFGLQLMKGKYFCFLDSDDVLTVKSVELRLKKFRMDDSINFVDGAVRMMDLNMKVTLQHRKQTYEGLPLNALLELDSSCFMGLTWMIKRRPDVTYMFKERMTNSEDLLFFIEIADQGKYVAIEEDILLYRRGHESASRNLKGLEKGYNEVYEYLVSNGLGSSYQHSTFHHKIRSIMFKSYLANGNVIDSIKQLKLKWF